MKELIKCILKARGFDVGDTELEFLVKQWDFIESERKLINISSTKEPTFFMEVNK